MEEYCKTLSAADIDNMRKLIYTVEKIFNIDIIETLKRDTLSIDETHKVSWDANIISPVFFGYNLTNIKTNTTVGGGNPFDSNTKLVKAYLYFLCIFILINFPELMGNGSRINWQRLFTNIISFIDSIVYDKCNEFENATTIYIGKALVELKVMTIKAFVGDENAKNFLKLLYLFGNAISKNALEIITPVDNIFTSVAENISHVQRDILPRTIETERQYYNNIFSSTIKNQISRLLADTFGITAPERIVIARNIEQEQAQEQIRGDEMVGGKKHTHKRYKSSKRKKSIKRSYLRRYK